MEARADDGSGLQARFAFDRAARQLTYRVTVYGVTDDAVLFTHIHRAVDGAAGPVTHLLGGGAQSRVAGTLLLSAADLRSLRAGDLYVDVHTRTNLLGVRAHIRWPEE